MGTTISAAQPMGRLVFVGTYTKGESRGIYAFRFDEARGVLAPGGLAAETPNPSFLVVSSDGRFLFAVNEVADYEGARSGSVTSFAIDRQGGRLQQLSIRSSRGADPCHLALDGTGKYLAVANYSSGNVAVLPVAADGRLGPAVTVVQHEGRGADPARQGGPHAHQVVFSADNRFLVVADLGLDQLVVYRFDPSAGTLTRHDPPAVSMPAGAGPRHFVFHPDGTRAFAINELASTITSLSWDGRAGVFRSGPSVSTLPADFKGRSFTAEIQVHPNGGFLYGSNRGHDSVAVFAVETGGRLSFVQAEPTRGKAPRHFTIVPGGRWLIAANQGSGSLSVFAIDAQAGRLAPVGPPVPAPTPVCVLLLR